MKRLLIFFLCSLICLTPCLLTSAEQSVENVLASQLAELGLIKGIGTFSNGKINFDLNRCPTRIEALIMLIRMLGKDDEAIEYGKTHPFSDVPEWADEYVSYAYDNQLANGISDTLFDCESLASAEMFLTLTLRALGYSDKGNTDFSWDNPWELAELCGILSMPINKVNFLRADMVNITCAALYAYVKGTETMLYEVLIENFVFSQQEFDTAFLGKPFEQSIYSKSKSKITARFTRINQVLKAPLSTVMLGYIDGTPHGSSAYLYLVYKSDCASVKAGEIVRLPLPQKNFMGSTAMPDEIKLSEDGTTLHYHCYFDQRLVVDEGTLSERIIHEAGTYSYETDICQATTNLSVFAK